MELTVPFEEDISLAKEGKPTKYQDLIEETKQRGFDVIFNTLQIGLRNMSGISSLSFIDDLDKCQISDLVHTGNIRKTYTAFFLGSMV